MGAGQKSAGSLRAGSRSPGAARNQGPCRHREIASLVRARQDPSRGHTAVKDDRLYLHHMLERCRRITRFIGPGRAAFMLSEELQDAVIRNVEVIGEAAKRVSAEARGRLASLDWKAICGMRDVPRRYALEPA